MLLPATARRQAANAISSDRARWPRRRRVICHGLAGTKLPIAPARELRVVVEHDPVFNPDSWVKAAREWRPEI